MPSVAERRDKVTAWIGPLAVAAVALAVVATAPSGAAARSEKATRVPCAKLRRQHRKLPARCRTKPAPAPTPSTPPAPTPPALVGAVKITMPFGRPDRLRASDNQLWIQIHGAGTLFAVDPQSNTIAAQAGPPNNPVCGLDPSTPGTLWLADCGRAPREVVRVDTQSKAVVATIPTESAFDVAVGAGAVWTADISNTVWRIDPVSNTVVQKIPVGPLPSAITVGYGSVWATSTGNGTLSRIDPASNSVTATIAVGPNNGTNPDLPPGPGSIVAGGGSIWVGNSIDNKLYKIDPATNTATALDIGSPAPRGNWPIMSLAYGADSVWALAGICDVARIDPTSGTVTKHYTICDPTTTSGTGGIAFAFGSLWVAFPPEGLVWRIQP
jgi:YVTN family beta-propeller protein